MGDSEIGRGAASGRLSIPAKGLMPSADAPSRRRARTADRAGRGTLEEASGAIANGYLRLDSPRVGPGYREATCRSRSVTRRKLLRPLDIASLPRARTMATGRFWVDLPLQ
jgi:hypothetical protein